MGIRNWLGIGKKKESSNEFVSGSLTDTVSKTIQDDKDIVVYSSNDATRCVSVRELLERNQYEFKDVRVDKDLSTRGWLQRTTGDDALPKVFAGSRSLGGFEDVQAMISDGTFEQAIRGDLDESGDQEMEQLKEDMTATSIAELLRRGEILTIDEGGSETDVWAEPFATPPVVYYEGAPEPIEEIEAVAQRIVDRIASGEIEFIWKDED